MKSRQRRIRQRLLIGLWAAVQLAMNAAWVYTRHHRLLSPTLQDLTGDLANWCAFNGLVFFALLVLLGSRNRIVEKAFGLDTMMLTHRRLAPAVAAFFVGHALLRTWSISIGRGVGYDVSFLYTLDMKAWDVTLGRLALMAMLALMALAYAGQKYFLLTFRTWKLPHLAFWLLFPMGMIHGLVHGDDTRFWPFLPLWILLAVLFAADGLWRLAYGLSRHHAHVWTIAALDRETEDVTSVYLSHPQMPGPFGARQAGAFGVLRAPGNRKLNEPHPFTFSGPQDHPGDRRLRVSVKAVGDWTSGFVTLPVGTPVLVEGPYGVFCADAFERSRLAFIAGGVGVTPFLSVLRTMRSRGLCIPTTLVWANKTRADIFSACELEAMVLELPLNVCHVISREQAHHLGGSSKQHISYHAGRISSDIFRRNMTGEEGIYMCGPEPMMHAALAALEEAFGLPAHAVRREHFFW